MPFPVAEHYLKLAQAVTNETSHDDPGGENPPSTLPQVATYNSQKVYETYGICSHSWGANSTIYRDANKPAIWAKLGDLKPRFVRCEAGAHQSGGQWVLDNNVQIMVTQAKNNGIGLLFLCVSEDRWQPTTQTIAQTQGVVTAIANNADAASVCYGLEGLNEPNQNRGHGKTIPGTSTICPIQTTGWQQDAYDHQVAIWNTARAHTSLNNALVVGCSLHNEEAKATRTIGGVAYPGGDWKRIFDLGINNYMDIMGIHDYPGGYEPENGLETTTNLFYRYFPDSRNIILSETYYHNALVTSDGHRPVSEAVAAAYVPRGILKFGAVRGGIKGCKYEMMDDADDPAVGGGKNITENNFGVIRVGVGMPMTAAEKSAGADGQAAYETRVAAATPSTTWEEKPEFTATRDFLAILRDPGGASHTTHTVGMRVTGAPADVATTILTQKQDGTTYAHFFRDLRIWNPVTRTNITVDPVTIVVEDDHGERSFVIDGSVTSVLLRPNT